MNYMANDTKSRDLDVMKGYVSMRGYRGYLRSTRPSYYTSHLYLSFLLLHHDISLPYPLSSLQSILYTLANLPSRPYQHLHPETHRAYRSVNGISFLRSQLSFNDPLLTTILLSHNLPLTIALPAQIPGAGKHKGKSNPGTVKKIEGRGESA